MTLRTKGERGDQCNIMPFAASESRLSYPLRRAASAAAELRRAFFQECQHALALVGSVR
jgi:hypothetical protein